MPVDEIPLNPCRFGSCCKQKGHAGEHICPCGTRVLDRSPGCNIHMDPPTCVTPAILKKYLYKFEDEHPIEHNAILAGHQAIVNIFIDTNHCVVLETFEQYLDRESRRGV